MRAYDPEVSARLRELREYNRDIIGKLTRYCEKSAGLTLKVDDNQHAPAYTVLSSDGVALTCHLNKVPFHWVFKTGCLFESFTSTEEAVESFESKLSF